MTERNTASINIQFPGAFFLFFLVLFVLKLGVGDTVVEDLSWLWVTAPLWGGLAIFLALALVFAVVGGSILGVATLLDKRDRKKRIKALNEKRSKALAETVALNQKRDAERQAMRDNRR